MKGLREEIFPESKSGEAENLVLGKDSHVCFADGFDEHIVTLADHNSVAGAEHVILKVLGFG